MKPSARRMLSMLLALALVIVAFMVFVNLVQPVYGEITALRADNIAKQEALAHQSKIKNDIQNLEGQYTSMTAFRESLSLALPADSSLDTALAQISGIAELNGVVISSISATYSVPLVSNNRAQGVAALVKPLSTLSFQLRITGDYASFKNFLRDVERNIRVFDVRAVSLNTTQLASQKGQASLYYAYDLALITYYQSSNK